MLVVVALDNVCVVLHDITHFIRSKVGDGCLDMNVARIGVWEGSGKEGLNTTAGVRGGRGGYWVEVGENLWWCLGY